MTSESFSTITFFFLQKGCSPNSEFTFLAASLFIEKKNLNHSLNDGKYIFENWFEGHQP